MSDTDLMDVAARFQSSKDKARILVATNVASEGLNLHHACHHLVHFDLPWSFITLEQRNGRIDRIGQQFTPHLYYLCSESSDPSLKADLHITEKLSNRILKAGISMDDPSLEAGFLSGEQEAEELTSEFEKREFEITLEEKEEVDFLSKFLIAKADENQKPKETIQNHIKDLESFYSSDYEFTKDALSFLEIEAEVKPEELIVSLDRELRFELEEAPREIINQEFIKLQFSKTKMAKEIGESIRFNEWPTSQWASDQHPLQELVKRKCLELFPGDQTPVVFYNGDSSDHKMGFLMQGILYNKHGQILFEEWSVCTFDSMFKKEAEPYGPYKISQIKDWSGLGGKNVVNPGEKLTTRLENTIYDRAVVSAEWMKGVMENLRNERGVEKGPKVKAERLRLDKWGKDRKNALESHLENLTSENSITSNFKKSEYEAELNLIEKTSKEYTEWVEDYYSSNKNPIIRIVGVFINSGKK